MKNYSQRLKNLDDNKLIDIVKNYRQYGYDEKLRATAVSILNSRGITKEYLKLTGNYENKTFDYANHLFKSFEKNSKIAFALFVVLLLTNMLVPVSSLNSESIGFLFLIVNFLVLIVYFIYLIKSFFDQNQFYKAINEDYGTEGALIYLILGMPFYIFMYFYFRNQMKEKIKSIK